MKDLNYIMGDKVLIKGLGYVYPLQLKMYRDDEYNYLFDILHLQVNMYLQDIPDNEKERRLRVSKEMKHWDIVCSNEENIKAFIKLLRISMKLTEESKVVTNFNETIVNIFNNKFDNAEDYMMELGKNVFIQIKDSIIDRNNYDSIRDYLIKINMLRFPQIRKTKKMQERINKKYKMDEQENQQDLDDIISTLCLEMKKFPKEFDELTMYQINSLASRVDKKYEHKMNVQFACVGAEDVKLESIMAHIDLFEEKESVVQGYEELMNPIAQKMNK